MAFQLRTTSSPLRQDEKEPSKIVKAYRKAAQPYYSAVDKIEENVNTVLSNPTGRANKKVDKYASEHSGWAEDVDKLRHGYASMYTSQAISRNLGGGTMAKIAGVIGSNVLGAGHEIGGINSDHGYVNGVVEMGKDMVNNFIGSVSNEGNIESNMKRFGTSGMSEATRKERLADIRKERESSPLRQQKLSPKAAKAKAERDLAYAKTPDRRAKKAEDQRRHRHDPSGKGKDWDHEDQRWEDPHQNRGNDGNGTKSESGKHYKVTKGR